MKKILPIIVALIVVGGGAFYGGMKYGQSIRRNFIRQNLSRQEFGTNMFPGVRTGRSGQGFVAGEIIAKDETSVTVKLRDGGSRIIFYSDSTEISKFVKGASDDLEIGKNIIVNGKINADGSITAESIQLRP